MPPHDATKRKPRRKRKAPANKEHSRSRLAYLKDYAKDDDTFRIDTEACRAELQKEIEDVSTTYVAPTKKKKTPRNALLSLLRQREVSSSWRSPKRKQWQSAVLIRSLDEDAKPVTANNYKSRKGFRNFTQRAVPFTKLKTPPSDAVLAIDRHGSYAVALSDMRERAGGSSDDNNSFPALSLNFYGIHSTSGMKKGTPAPLLQTVPLLPPCNSRRLRGGMSAVVTNQANILISNDWNLGVAFVSEVNNNNNNGIAIVRARADQDGIFRINPHELPPPIPDQKFSVVLFSLPKSSNTTLSSPDAKQPVVQTYTLSGASADSLKGATMRNLLWKVDQIPFKARKKNEPIPEHMEHLHESLCDSTMDRSGYLLFIDESHGFRLTWITDSSWAHNDETAKDINVKPIMPLSHLTTHETPNIIAEILDSDGKKRWKEGFHDGQTGIVISDDESNAEKSTTNNGNLRVAFEAFLDIKLLLGEILMSTGMTQVFSDDDFDDVLPDRAFAFNIQSVNDGRTCDLVIVFRSHPERETGCHGVYVSLDLFTQNYAVKGWVENDRACNDRASLRRLCNSLTIRRRIRQRWLGPFSVHPRSRRRRQREARRKAQGRRALDGSHRDPSSDEHNYYGDTKSDVFDEYEYPCVSEERYFWSGHDFDMQRDMDPSQWEPYCEMVEQAKSNGDRAKLDGTKQKIVPFSSLYPDCELITNRTLSSALPTAVLTGRMSPLKIVYR